MTRVSTVFHLFHYAFRLSSTFSVAGKPPPENYVPEDESEDALFKSVQVGINFDKYDKIVVELTGNSPTKPIQNFSEAGLLETVESNVKKANYFKPTPIQKYAIPAIAAGRDMMGCAQTGSGKTVSLICIYRTHLMTSPACFHC